MSDTAACDGCNGTGDDNGQPCPHCNGTGRIGDDNWVKAHNKANEKLFETLKAEAAALITKRRN